MAMTLLKCATHVVADVADAAARYATWLDYRVIEQGVVDAALAALWQAPASAGRPYAVLQPASGAPTFLRFVAGDPQADYTPIRSYGWAATEICVTDVEAVNARMQASPFEIIGPPKPIDGFAVIKAMQVRGPDREIVYLTQILAPGPEHGLPLPQTLVDRPFIMVLACADMPATMRWARDVLGLEVIEPVAIRYTMIAKSFALPEGVKTEISTGRWGDHVFLEFDQYPPDATPRSRLPGQLPPGIAITTIEHPDFARLDGHWAVAPAPRAGAIYAGRRTGLVLTPEGALLEVIEA